MLRILPDRSGASRFIKEWLLLWYAAVGANAGCQPRVATGVIVQYGVSHVELSPSQKSRLTTL